MSLRFCSFVHLCLAFLLLSGCDRTTKHRTLAFFFDGVPPLEQGTKKQKQAKDAKPGKTAAASQPAQSLKKVDAAQTFVHPPYAERLCDSCHEGQFSQRLVAQGKELCFTCHEDFLKNAKVKHYPAEEGLCLECHLPHRSPFPKMLKQKGQALCFTCHDKGELVKVTPHDSIDDTDCIDCHDPHRGEEKLLK